MMMMMNSVVNRRSRNRGFGHFDVVAIFVSVQVLALGFGVVPEERSSVSPRMAEVELSRQRSWSRAAYRYITSLDCKRVRFTTSKECQRLTSIDLNQTNVYLALPSATAEGRMVTIFPESSPVQSEVEYHDGVLALDPYPAANFGHLVVVFYVDLNQRRQRCERDNGGIWLTGSGDCLQLAVQRRCKNSLMKRQRRRNFARRCEINFIPLVHLSSDQLNRTQQLVCRADLGSVLPCPSIRPPGDASGPTSCDPLRENSKRCETTHEIFESACHVLKICDHAVVLSGGWNAWSVRKHHADNVQQFHRMLRKNGFPERNIKVFFADGRIQNEQQLLADGIDEVVDSSSSSSSSASSSSSSSASSLVDAEVHPATESKMAMRYQIQRLCSTAHCVDSLVLYLNSPSTNDGTTLLWDLDHDGIASENERYSLDELMSDVVDCHARHLHVIVDQSYSGNILRAFKRYRRHPNVIVYVSSKDTEYSFGDEFTRVWTQINHTTVCTKAVFKKAKKRLRQSSPQIYIGDQSSNVNLFGAPCDVRPPLTQGELRQNYLGCQNLPWTMKLLKPTPQMTDTDTRLSQTRAPIIPNARITSSNHRRQRTSRHS